MGLLDSTLDFEEEEDKMKKIIAFFANLPKVAGLVQGMVDMMGSLTRILPLVADKIEDHKLKAALERTINIVELGLGKVLKICAFLGMKVKRGESKAIGHIVKNRFKKHDKKDLLEFEVDELNKYLDALEKIDEIPPKPIHGQIPLDVKPNHLYPQKMPLRGRRMKREDLRPVVPPQPPIPVPEGQKIEGQVPPDPIPPPAKPDSQE